MNFDADPYLAGLKKFQRDTVDHVVRRFYEDQPEARRFLVADETGLGKSMVARGVIARTIERLQHDETVERIDIVYVCSNGDIARQNLERLDVLGTGSQHNSRLTMLAAESDNLSGDPHPVVGKRVNLIAFTPGTSLNLGRSGGQARERALLHLILTTELDLDRWQQRTAAAMLQGDVKRFDTFWASIDDLKKSLCDDELGGANLDREIVDPFMKEIRSSRLKHRFMSTLDRLGRRTSLDDGEKSDAKQMVGQLRMALAKAGVDALEPDLVILDEFQRFRYLLDVNDPSFGDAAELARSLFDFRNSKVLLLSATPYKPFTYADEAIGGDDHEVDLRRTLEFLAGDPTSAHVETIVDDLAAFRRSAIDGSDVLQLRERLRESLTQLMCRTERPQLGEDGMLMERLATVDEVSAQDIKGFVAMRELAQELDVPINIDYWKSTPYFINFADGYKLGDALRAELKDPGSRDELRTLIASTQHLRRSQVRDRLAVDGGNARLRKLMEDTIGAGWWKLLWIPPSLPYVPLGGPFAEVPIGSVTKRLIFSSWASTPTAIAALVSHDANRMIAAGSDRDEGVSRRLTWRTSDGRPANMTALMLFLPVPGVALGSDPRHIAEPFEMLEGSSGAESWYWHSLLAGSGGLPAGLGAEDAVSALARRGAAEDPEAAPDALGLRPHLELAAAVAAGDQRPDHRLSKPADLDGVLAAIAQFAPANIAYRGMHRLAAQHHLPEAAVWKAAAVVSSGVQALFNRPESAQLLDQLLPGVPYWRAILVYCRWGNLEAVLDEYLHHLEADAAGVAMSEERLLDLATRVSDAMTMRPSQYEAFDPTNPDKPITFSSRFALRYGNKTATSDENKRLPEVRKAFNSPFWPFVLATTSVGQEGIDFHWWCHATVHWNTPANPVDFEQREGRVSRFGGHVIRKNLAARFESELFESISVDRNLWTRAYELGGADPDARFEELVPHWIFAGPSKVERHLLNYPLSKDLPRYERLKNDLALYRLTFGQPRQEDMLKLLEDRNVLSDKDRVAELRIDLRPPKPKG